MYAVVGCRECGALWIVDGRPDTTGCPRCGTRYQFRRLRRFAEADDAAAARAARAKLLADRAGEDLEDSDVEGDRAKAPVVSDEELLEGLGIDAEVVADAGNTRQRHTPGTRETVLAALNELESPSEEAIVEYATERGVPAVAVREMLERLTRAGEASETGGRFRLV